MLRNLKTRLLLIFLVTVFTFMYLGIAQFNYIDCKQTKKEFKIRNLRDDLIDFKAEEARRDETTKSAAKLIFQAHKTAREETKSIMTLAPAKDAEPSSNSSSMELSCNEIHALMVKSNSYTEFR